MYKWGGHETGNNKRVKIRLLSFSYYEFTMDDLVQQYLKDAAVSINFFPYHSFSIFIIGYDYWTSYIIS